MLYIDEMNTRTSGFTVKCSGSQPSNYFIYDNKNLANFLFIDFNF